MRTVRVVAGGLFDAAGRVLIAQRPAGAHMAGRWEFPGGKIDGGESELQALSRELTEELGVKLLSAERMLQLTHEYAERFVELSMWLVTAYEGQALKWVKPADLANEDLLEADRPIVAALMDRAATSSPSAYRRKIS